MAAQENVPRWNVTNRHPARNASASVAIDPNLLLVHDGTNVDAVKVPATSATITSFAGVADRKIAASSYGDVCRTPGDKVVVKAGTGNVAVGDRIIIDTASGKEGRGKAYSSGAAFIVGIARTAADDGDLFEMEIQIQTYDA